MKTIEAAHAEKDEPNCYMNSDCMCRETRGRAQPTCIHYRNIRSPSNGQVNTAPTHERIAEVA